MIPTPFLLALTLLLTTSTLAVAQVQTDRFGIRTGRIGGALVRSLTRNGMTTGRIGNEPVIGQRDALGHTCGTIGPQNCR